jgi:hypothetical protein
MRNAPLIGAGRTTHTPDLRFGKTEIFFKRGWTRGLKTTLQTAPDGQITSLSEQCAAARVAGLVSVIAD